MRRWAFLGLSFSAVAVWASFVCLVASIAAHNAAGMFWYGIGLIVSGVAVKLCLK